MSADPALRRATYADLEAVPAHLVAEIIDGRLETHHHGIPALGFAIFRLSAILQEAFGRRGDGLERWTFVPRIEFRHEEDVLVPDLAGWSGGRLKIVSDDALVTSAPDWICEILSPETSRLDRGAKRRIYGEAGVKHLWLLDASARLLECFDRYSGRWRLLATFLPGDEVRVAPFDAIGFPLDALFPFDEPDQKPSEEA